MTKIEIVERLLEEGNITAKEAAVLLKEEVIERIVPQDNNPFVGPGIVPFDFPKITPPFEITGDDDMVPYGEICSCNPKNGGSGICGCIMANKLVPKDSGGQVVKWSTNITGCNNEQCFCEGSCKK